MTIVESDAVLHPTIAVQFEWMVGESMMPHQKPKNQRRLKTQASIGVECVYR